MGFLTSIKTGLKLTRDSLAVLREHPKLMTFPFLGGLLSLAFGAVLVGGVVIGDIVGGGLEYVTLFAFYFATTFLASFFTAALVYSANEAFHGREPTVRSGLAAAWRKKRALAVWAAISAIVGVLLKQLEKTDSPLAAIARSLFALGWYVTTFFAVPVIVFEDVGVRELFERSASTFRDTWGETLTTGFGVGLIQLAIGLVGVILVIAVTAAVGSVTAGLAGIVTLVVGVVLVLVVAYLVGQTVSGITKTALYVYAEEGRIPAEFENFDFETLDGRTGTRTRAGERGAAPGADG